MSKNEKENDFLPIRDAEVFTGIKQQTLRKLFKEGLLQGYTREHGQRMFSRESLYKYCNKVKRNEENVNEKTNILYARVSSKKQVNDMDRQIEYLKSNKLEYQSYRIISDIASGINFKRKGLLEILDKCLQGTVGNVVVAHRDRLSRFGFELIKTIIEKAGGQLTVIDNEKQMSTEQELAQDLLSIVHIYSCKQMGKRSYKNKNINTSIEINKQSENIN